jgi:hypothetical protein
MASSIVGDPEQQLARLTKIALMKCARRITAYHGRQQTKCK